MDPLEKLRLADPETHEWVSQRLTLIPASRRHLIDVLVTETIWGLTLEKGLALALAGSMIPLMAKADRPVIDAYLEQVHQAAETGPTLARILADHLGPVLTAGPPLVEKFQNALIIMARKGTYTLNAPLNLLTELLEKKDRPGAMAYTDLLAVVFQQPMTFNQSQRLVHIIPRAIQRFTPQRRAAQITQLTRVADTSLDLIDAFLEGLDKGLDLLTNENLGLFVNRALDRHGQDPASGAKFLSLTARIGQDTCAALQVYAPLSQVRRRLNGYLSARLGRPMDVRPLSDLGPRGCHSDLWACTDGRDIFIRDEIGLYGNQQANIDLYFYLVRLEAGFLECDSYGFNLERAARQYPAVGQWLDQRKIDSLPDTLCDAQRFFQSFDVPPLAEDLFLILELARILGWTARRYPGLHRRLMAELVTTNALTAPPHRTSHPLMPTYQLLIQGRGPGSSLPQDQIKIAGLAHDLFTALVDHRSPVEACADILCRCFKALDPNRPAFAPTYQAMVLPFNIRLHWDIFNAAFNAHDETARQLQQRLAHKKLTVNRTDLQYQLFKHQGRLEIHDIKALVLAQAKNSVGQGMAIDLSMTELAALADGLQPDALLNDRNDHEAFFYPEWDHQLHDYLQHYARVQETPVPASGTDIFYRHTLDRHRGLVAHVRRAFEFLKPEGLVLLRQWPEGDAFDYRALLDFMVDRRTGRIPSERLYIKRLKQQRDVAALVLVDLSRSTANLVSGKQTSVLHLTKEALVLFCEALTVVGDTYALAGFSGTGRHSVDYYRIKDFQEPLGPSVHARISDLAPQRSTRMGAAIRHAARQLAGAPAQVRLMIIISDGFPNDLGYKADYAIADTRKAVQEARHRSIFVKAVTVNIGRDPRLDDLYGRSHSHVIEDVAELPTKLLRLYSTLTRPA